jgi:hypothetical protein
MKTGYLTEMSFDRKKSFGRKCFSTKNYLNEHSTEIFFRQKFMFSGPTYLLSKLQSIEREFDYLDLR